MHTTGTENRPRRFSTPRLLLHIEGVAVFAAAVALYIQQGANGWAFIILLLAPDLSMLGYAFNPRVGAALYNLAHVYALPLTLALIALLTTWTPGIALALIWLAHIGMDRALGYGLKYPTGFKDTHMSRV